MRILKSTTSDNSRASHSKVLSALYAGITTAIRFPLIMGYKTPLPLSLSRRHFTAALTAVARLPAPTPGRASGGRLLRGDGELRGGGRGSRERQAEIFLHYGIVRVNAQSGFKFGGGFGQMSGISQRGAQLAWGSASSGARRTAICNCAMASGTRPILPSTVPKLVRAGADSGSMRTAVSKYGRASDRRPEAIR